MSLRIMFVPVKPMNINKIATLKKKKILHFSNMSIRHDTELDVRPSGGAPQAEGKGP